MVRENDQVQSNDRWSNVRHGVVVHVNGDWCDVCWNDDQVVEQVRVESVDVC